MTETRKQYYRGIDQFENEAEFRKLLKREHPNVDPDTLDGVSRRRFMQLLGASAALASATGCTRWEEDHLAVENQRGEIRKPGVPQHFATAMELSGCAQPLLMTCYDGRPIKTEGNPLHPQSNGASSTYAQAAVLELYDPDRSRGPARRTNSDLSGWQAVTWDDVTKTAAELFGKARQKQGEGFAVLAQSTSSATFAEERRRLLEALPKAGFHEYQPISDDNLREGSRLAFGAPHRTHLHLKNADVIVCLADDLLEGHPAALEHAREFARRRAPESAQMNRLYVIEGDYSVTGSSADHRLPLRPGLIGAFVQLLESKLGVAGVAPGPLATNGKIDRYATALANDLKGKKGRSVISVGAGQPPAVIARVHRLNATLGNVGQTVTYSKETDHPTHAQAIKDLVAAMNAGKVETLLILGGNPVYDAPADLEFAAALGKVGHSVHLSSHVDETSNLCTTHLPLAHFLESWGDARSHDGTLSVIQPCIAPLWGGKSAIEVLALFNGDELTEGFDLVRRALDQVVGADEKKWRTLVHDGLLEGSAFPAAVATLAAALPDLPIVDAGAPANGSLELAFKPCSKVFDGRFANNAWLQELPDFMTKGTWDNYALMGKATADGLGVKNETIVNLKYQGRAIACSAYILPGHASGLVTVALGYGRTTAGVVGGHHRWDDHEEAPIVSFDTYKLRTADAPWFGAGLTVEPTGEYADFALTQDHHLIDTTGMEGREERLETLVREGTLTQTKETPDFVTAMDHGPELLSLWTESTFEGESRWGMSIDLSKCTGCNACVMACQSENNVPVVGKEQVKRGREMHWLRIDRYFAGDIEDPTIATQPLPCQQCENAPCEQVCPVAATQHSKEGLNDMTYNRCIGTRYCSNNCPYKVRRFNFFNYQLHLKQEEHEVLKLAFNPEVTVRSRGVMEKCTYCVQRISVARIKSKNERRKIADGEVVPACAQSCAAEAIVFGDLADPESRVLYEHSKKRAYALLGELNSKPRTVYLARITNPNPELAGA